MAEESFQEKSEQATPKRRDEARRKGQTAKSQELNSAVVLIAGIIGLYMLGGYLNQNLATFTVQLLERSHTFEFTPGNLHTYMLEWGKVFFSVVGPIVLIIGTAALGVSVGQVGFTLNEEAMKFNLNRLNPISGAKRILSKRSLVELVKNIFKIFIVGYVGYRTIGPAILQITLLADASVGAIFQYAGYMVFKVGLNTALILLLMAILDYIYQRWEFNQSIRMTKQEIKEEQKQTEGDPQVRMRIRSLQREAARKRMMDEVPNADVVITNPTHYAVAIQYDMDTMDAPKVVAKGQNLVAQRIKQLARDTGIPVVENKPLAQALFRAVEVGQGIPEDLYRAVAEVLAYVFRLKNRRIEG
ncbi:MAG: flagellar biosynthesis protein FlhB [bacterium]|nr:flagellar biosynthesis protein FlhB [bacterium]